jgi:predicted nucleotidyltransferase
MKKYSVADKEKEKIISIISSALEKEISIVFSYIYGSFLEGSFKDIDVAIFIDEAKIPSFLRYELQMESLLNKAVGKFVFDVRILNGAPLSFRYEVIKNGKLIMTKDEESRIDFETSTISNYFDFAPFRHSYLKEVLGIGRKQE